MDKTLRILLLTVGLTSLLPGHSSAVTVNFDGELLDRPCQIAPESTQQEVAFLDRPAKDFWFPPARSPVERFTIRLIECDTSSIWKVVKLKFSGTPETNMTGKSDYFLKVQGVNEGRLGIGLLDTDGKTPLKLGDAQNHGQGTDIAGEMVLLTFGAFVQATPGSLATVTTSGRVQPGDYTSTANFELFYE